MNDSTNPVDDTSPASATPVFGSPPKRGRRRIAATIVGGALLFAGGAGTGAVVATAAGSSTSAGAATVAGPGGQPPGQTGTGGLGAPNGTAPTGAPVGGTAGS
jgi:hypothetical protein